MTKPTSEDDIRTDYGSDATTRELNKNTKFKIGDEFLKILLDNAFNGRRGGGDGVDGGNGDGAVARLRWWGDHDGGGDCELCSDDDDDVEMMTMVLEVVAWC
ncbi:hypothetical protein Tco_0833001 [Tanacetum coccineum]